MFYCLSRWLTYSLLILHYVIPPVLLGEVRSQHIEAPPKLGEHHVIRVTCEGQYRMTTLHSGQWCSRRLAWYTWTGSPCVSWHVPNMWQKPLLHLACRSGEHRAAWSRAAEHGAKLHLVALIRDLHYPLEPRIPLPWTGIHSGPWGHLP